MHNQHDLQVLLRSRVPIVVIETQDESRLLDLLKSITLSGIDGDYLPLFRWTVTDGLQRLDIDLEPQLHNADPPEVLKATVQMNFLKNRFGALGGGLSLHKLFEQELKVVEEKLTIALQDVLEQPVQFRARPDFKSGAAKYYGSDIRRGLSISPAASARWTSATSNR